MNGRTGFIFARGGSKGISGKNLREIGGISLVGRAVRCALESRHIDRVVISTDDERIAEEAVRHGAQAPFLRPAELARDASPEIDAWRHAITAVGGVDLFVSIPPTAPLRTAADLDACIDLFLEGGADIVITAKKAARHPAFNMITLDEHGYAGLVCPPEGPIVRRQDAPPVYDMTTLAYVAAPEYVMTTDSLLGGRIKAHIVPDERAVDIDSMTDLLFAEFLLQHARTTQGENA